MTLLLIRVSASVGMLNYRLRVLLPCGESDGTASFRYGNAGPLTPVGCAKSIIPS
jgi:hypothetical protein